MLRINFSGLMSFSAFPAIPAGCCPRAASTTWVTSEFVVAGHFALRSNGDSGSDCRLFLGLRVILGDVFGVES